MLPAVPFGTRAWSSSNQFMYRHGFLGQPGECIHTAGVSAKRATDDGGCAESEPLGQPLML